MRIRATVNLAKKLKKEGEAKSQKRRSQIIGDASASQIGNGISGNTADAGGQPVIQVVLPRLGESILRRRSQGEHERDPATKQRSTRPKFWLKQTQVYFRL